MLNGLKVAVIMPAYNAAATLKKTYANLPKELVDDVILTDDFSSDETVELSRSLGIHTLIHTSEQRLWRQSEDLLRRGARARRRHRRHASSRLPIFAPSRAGYCLDGGVR
jgi:glycosyltransferase involved in cell wall biosynthesis